MRIQFVFNMDICNTVDIDVAEVPTDEEAKAIEEEVCAAMDAWEEEYGDCAEFDFYKACFDAVIRHTHIAYNPVVRTIYI